MPHPAQLGITSELIFHVIVDHLHHYALVFFPCANATATQGSCLMSLHQCQVSTSLMVASLSCSSLSSAAAIFSGTVLLALSAFSRSRALDSSMMPSSDGHRDSCTYRLYGSHWLGTAF